MYQKVPLVLSRTYIDKIMDNPLWMKESGKHIKTVNEVFAKEIAEIGCGILSPRDIVRVVHMTKSNPYPFDMIDAAYKWAILYATTETRELYNSYLAFMRKHAMMHILQLNHMEPINYELVEQVFWKVIEFVRANNIVKW